LNSLRLGAQPRSLYDLRHTYITQKLREGVPQMIVAENTLTSVQMIERYYAHLRAEMNFDGLAGGGTLRNRRQRGT
jgi:integrase